MDTQIAVSHEEPTGSFNAHLMGQIALEALLLRSRGFSTETVDAAANLALRWQQVDMPSRPRRIRMVPIPRETQEPRTGIRRILSVFRI